MFYRFVCLEHDFYMSHNTNTNINNNNPMAWCAGKLLVWDVTVLSIFNWQSLTLPPQLEDVVRLLIWLLPRSAKSTQKAAPHTRSFQSPWRRLVRWMNLLICFSWPWQKNRRHLWWQPRNIFHFLVTVSHHAALHCGYFRSARRFGPPAIPHLFLDLSLIHIWRCRRIERCRSRWSPYH